MLRSFLGYIGAVNAASLSYLCINFPVAEGEEAVVGKDRIRDDSRQSLALLRQQCDRLSTLELIIHYKNYGFFLKTDELLRNTLPHIDTQLRTIPSLDRTIVRIEAHGQILTSSSKELMQELGSSVITSETL